MILTPIVPLQFSDSGGYQKITDIKQLIKFHLPRRENQAFKLWSGS